VRRGQCQLRDTVPPTPVRLMHRTLEGGPVTPSNPPLVTLQGQTVTSGRRERHPVVVTPVRPSSSLQRHAVHCYNYSDVVGNAGTGHRHACHCTPYGSLSSAPSSPHGDAPVDHYASTLEAPLFNYRGRRDAVTGARFARTSTISPALYAIPPHIAK
jgi:hypothetical protein